MHNKYTPCSEFMPVSQSSGVLEVSASTGEQGWDFYQLQDTSEVSSSFFSCLVRV